MNRLRRSETFLKLTVRGMMERTAGEFSYHTLSRSFGVGTVKTAISYVELLERLHLLKVVERVDLEGNVMPRREKRFYFIDPFIYRAFAFWTSARLPDGGGLVESIVLTHLSRIYDVHYTKAGDEVDVVVEDGEPIGFEVKFGRVRHERRILGRMKKIYILSKDMLGDDVIPVSLFLAMLNIPQTIELKILE